MWNKYAFCLQGACLTARPESQTHTALSLAGQRFTVGSGFRADRNWWTTDTLTHAPHTHTHTHTHTQLYCTDTTCCSEVSLANYWLRLSSVFVLTGSYKHTLLLISMSLGLTYPSPTLPCLWTRQTSMEVSSWTASCLRRWRSRPTFFRGCSSVTSLEESVSPCLCSSEVWRFYAYNSFHQVGPWQIPLNKTYCKMLVVCILFTNFEQ